MSRGYREETGATVGAAPISLEGVLEFTVWADPRIAQNARPAPVGDVHHPRSSLLTGAGAPYRATRPFFSEYW